MHTDREIPEDLDALMAEALRTGRVSKLQSALRRLPSGPTHPDPPELAPPEEAGTREPLAEQPPESPKPEPDASPERIWAALDEALQRGRAGDREALVQARAHLDALLALPEEPQKPEDEPIRLPPYRLPWALVVDPPRDEAQGRKAANALKLDLSSGRMVARSQHPKVALRSRDRMDLLQRADDWEQQMGLPARVCDAQQLLAIGPASLVLRLGRDTPWHILQGRGWRSEPDQLNAEGTAIPRPEVRLVVPGEVVIERYRDLGGQLLKQNERRLRVADLHGPGRFLRCVEGLTRFDGWPELNGMSATQAFRAFTELIVDTWPAAVPGPRRCKPLRDAKANDEGRAESSGWAEWEEHSRLCKVLLC